MCTFVKVVCHLNITVLYLSLVFKVYIMLPKQLEKWIHNNAINTLLHYISSLKFLCHWINVTAGVKWYLQSLLGPVAYEHFVRVFLLNPPAQLLPFTIHHVLFLHDAPSLSSHATETPLRLHSDWGEKW